MKTLTLVIVLALACLAITAGHSAGTWASADPTVPRTQSSDDRIAADPLSDHVPFSLHAHPGNGEVELNWPLHSAAGFPIEYVIKVREQYEPNFTTVGWYCLDPFGERGHQNDSLVKCVELDKRDFTYEHTVMNLTNGVEYEFLVQIIGSEYTTSSTVRATPTGPPGPPQNLLGLPGDDSVTLTWSAPDNDGGSPITYYYISGKVKGHDFFGVGGAIPATTTSYTVGGLTGGIPYEFRVQAWNTIAPGPKSGSETVTPNGAPYVYTLTGKPIDQGVTLQWEPNTELECRIASSPGGLEMEVCYDEGNQPWLATTADEYVISTRIGKVNPLAPIATVPGSSTAYTVKGLTNGMPYEFVILGRNDVGHGPLSNTVTATPATLPEAPTNLKYVVQPSRFELLWDAPIQVDYAPIKYYVVTAKYKQPTSFLYTTETHSTSGPVTSITIPRFTQADYDLTVSAVNTVGMGPQSEKVSYHSPGIFGE